MFSKKLDYYDKPCKWLKFLLNIWWPIILVYNIWLIIQYVLDWNNSSTFPLILSIIMAVALISVDLFARFLDKTAMIAIYFLQALSIVCDICALIYKYITLKGVSDSVNIDETGIGVIDAGANMASGIIGAAMGIAFFFFVVVTLIEISVSVSTFVYIHKRKDLFLSTEKQLKKLYE